MKSILLLRQMVLRLLPIIQITKKNILLHLQNGNARAPQSRLRQRQGREENMTLDSKKNENRIYNEVLEISFISTAFYLLDKLGVNPKKTIMTISNISEIAESIRSGNVSVDELKETLENEYHFKITRKPKGVEIEVIKEDDI